MGVKLKTVKFLSGTGVAIPNNVDSFISPDVNPVKIYLPESGIVFKSVIVRYSIHDSSITTTNNITQLSLGIRFNTTTDPTTVILNSNAIVSSAENSTYTFSYDFTTHFQTYWSGVEVNCLVNSLMVNSAAIGMDNPFTEFEITYEYDDTSPTLVKTVLIPLNCPVSSVPTTVTTYDTFPALNIYLPESNKSIKDIKLVIQGNTHSGTATTDVQLSYWFGTFEGTVNRIYKKTLATNVFFRLTTLNITYFNFDTSYDFRLISTVASAFNHLQAYVIVTYTYEEATTTEVMNSLMLPMDVESPSGFNSVSYQRTTREFWIQEPGPIVTDRVAFYNFWTQIVSTTGLNMRIGTGAFVAYTDNLSVISGSNAAMLRNDTAFTLVRGKNTLNFDVYSTIQTWNLSGFWIVNYKSAKATQGSHSHNSNLSFGLMTRETTGAAIKKVSSSKAPVLSGDYFINSLGIELNYMTTGTVTPSGFSVQVERLATEGGLSWENCYRDLSVSDNEVGIYVMFSQIRSLFKKYVGDDLGDKLNINTNRRWRCTAPLPTTTAGSGWPDLNLRAVCHYISYEISGTITGFSGPVTIDLWSTSGEKVKSMVRAGDGPYSFTWYDDTIPMFVTAKDSSSFAKSKTDIVDNLFDIAAGDINDAKYFAF